MKLLLHRSFKPNNLIGTIARRIHAFESPRFAQFFTLKPNQGEDFLRGITSFEEKVALVNYAQSVGNPELEKIASGFRSSTDYPKLKDLVMRKIDEVTPQTLSQFIRVYLHTFTQEDTDVISKRVESFMAENGRNLSDIELDFVFDCVNYLLYVSKFGNKGIAIGNFDVKQLEAFYAENSSRLNVMNHMMFASLYRQQEGYKKDLVESIITWSYSKRAYIDTTKYLNILIVCFEEIFSDALTYRKLFTNKALKSHQLFPILQKFDEAEIVHVQASMVSKDKLVYLLNLMNACKIEDSLPHISEFLFDIFRNIIVNGSDVGDVLVIGNLLLNQKIDINEDEAATLATQISAYLKTADNMPTELLAVLFLSKQASAGM
jgi:hypothetical protein